MDSFLNAEYDPSEFQAEIQEEGQLEETSEVQDEYLPEQQGEEQEIGGDEEKYIFTKTDEEGNEVQEEYTQAEILEALNAKQEGTSTEVPEDFKTLAPFIEQVRQDELLKNVLHYKAEGHSNGEIVDGLFLLRHPEYKDINPQMYWQLVNMYQNPSSNPGFAQQPKEEPIPEFDTLAEETQYYAKKAVQEETKQIKEMLAQLQGNTQQFQAQQQASSTLAANDQLLGQALAGAGLNAQLSNEELTAMYNEMQALWPGIDPRTYRFTPAQAERLVKSAFGIKKESGGIASQMTLAGKKPDTKQMVKAAKAPSVLPGTRGTASNDPLRNVMDSRSRRVKAIDELFWNK